MLKNNQEAKFETVLQPICEGGARRPTIGSNVAFDAFFTHILMHELMHGLGPHNITVGGRATTVRQELKDIYSTIEEAKADISGLFALQFLVDTGSSTKPSTTRCTRRILASMFRSIRFGITEAHGRGVAIQLNYFLDHGGVTVAQDGTFAVNLERIRKNVVDLTRDIMTMQATGDVQAGKQMLDKLGVVRPQVQTVLDRLKDVPVDIEPRFVTADQLLRNRRPDRRRQTPHIIRPHFSVEPVLSDGQEASCAKGGHFSCWLSSRQPVFLSRASWPARASTPCRRRTSKSIPIGPNRCRTIGCSARRSASRWTSATTSG